MSSAGKSTWHDELPGGYPIIQLTPDDIRLAAMAGVDHVIDIVSNNRAHRGGGKDLGHWANHIESKMSELALSKFLDEPWTGAKDAIGTADVGSKHDAKWTRTRPPVLYVKQQEPAERIYWLIIGRYGRYCVCGWISGRLIKRAINLKDGRHGIAPSFQMPMMNLNHPAHWISDHAR